MSNRRGVDITAPAGTFNLPGNVDELVPLKAREKKVNSIKEAIRILQDQQSALEASIRTSKDGVKDVKQGSRKMKNKFEKEEAGKRFKCKKSKKGKKSPKKPRKKTPTVAKMMRSKPKPIAKKSKQKRRSKCR
jgi:hypothetical protein